MDNKEAVKRLLLLLNRYKKNYNCYCLLFVYFYGIESLCTANQPADHG